MDNVRNRYEDLDGAVPVAYYPNGAPREVVLSKPNRIVTPCGIFVPQYRQWEDGRRHESILKLYPDGVIKSFTLQHRTVVATSVGAISCEAVNFHEDGSLSRIFPLNGKLSGFWNEASEYALAEAVSIKIPYNSFLVKIISAAFYPSGNLRSVTLWPNERIVINTPAGKCRVRTGVSFYENGSVRSVEPADGIAVATPIGMMTAFDPDPNGLCGDINSLEFTMRGEVKSVSSVKEKITVSGNGEAEEFMPGRRHNLCFETVMDPVALRVSFTDNYVIFNNSEVYVYSRHDFKFTVSDHRHVCKLEPIKYVCSET